jgi:hypothetical protein
MRVWWVSRREDDDRDLDPALWRLFLQSREQLEVDEDTIARGRERLLQTIQGEQRARVPRAVAVRTPALRTPRLSALIHTPTAVRHIAIALVALLLLGGGGVAAVQATGVAASMQLVLSRSFRARRDTGMNGVATTAPATPELGPPVQLAAEGDVLAERDGPWFKLRARVGTGTTAASVVLDTAVGTVTLGYAGAVVHARRAGPAIVNLADYIGSTVDVSGLCAHAAPGLRVVNGAEASAHGIGPLTPLDFAGCLGDSVQILGRPDGAPTPAAGTSTATAKPGAPAGLAHGTADPGPRRRGNGP